MTINFTLNASKINMSWPYPEFTSILNKTKTGDFLSVITDTNSAMDMWPMRFLAYGLFIILTGMGKAMLPNTDLTKIIAASAIVTAVVMGMASFIGLVDLVEAAPFIVIAAMGAWAGRGR